MSTVQMLVLLGFIAYLVFSYIIFNAAGEAKDKLYNKNELMIFGGLFVTLLLIFLFINHHDDLSKSQVMVINIFCVMAMLAVEITLMYRNSRDTKIFLGILSVFVQTPLSILVLIAKLVELIYKLGQTQKDSHPPNK